MPVAATVRLMHRRRGWVWATVVSVIAFVVACGLLGSLAPNASGAGLGVASVLQGRAALAGASPAADSGLVIG